MSPLRSFYLFAACLLTTLTAAAHPRPPDPPSTVAREDPPLFPLSEVARGQRGQGWTVFDSAVGPEPFDFEVLGVMRGYLGPGEDLIIAELQGEKIERTGVISGMSGSPVYIDGRLVGAVGYRFGAFTEKPIAGITPIERMLTVGGSPSSGKMSPATGPARRGASSAFGAAEPLAVPVMTSGLPERVIEAFQPMLDKRGYGPFVPGAGPSSGARAETAEPSQRFFAGGPIAGLLVDGDVQMAGVGTVTWVKGDRVLAFGHPFLGNGASSMPIANAWIVTTVASRSGSWKMGQATTAQGALTDDRLHAIAGDMSARPDTVAVTARLFFDGPRSQADARQTLRYAVLRHPTDTPLFTALALANGLSSRVGVEVGGTIEVRGDVRLRSGQQVQFARRAAGEGVPLDVNAALAVLAELSDITDSGFEGVEIDRIDLSITRRADVHRWEVVSVEVLERLEPGKTAKVRARLQAFEGPLEERIAQVRVPSGLLPGRYSLVAAARKEALELETDGGLLGEALDFDSLLRSKAAAPPDGSVTLYLVMAQDGVRVDGQSLQGLPASLGGLLEGAGGRSERRLEERAYRLHRWETSGTSVGAARARVDVERRSPF
ncbi:MAG: hypothetical protein ACO3JL_05230 [Myxococcota bacterium]